MTRTCGVSPKTAVKAMNGTIQNVNGWVFGPSDSLRRMGREAECTVTYKGRSKTQKALLETEENIVRGEPRIVVKRSEISDVAVEGGDLVIEWPGGTISLRLGPAAQTWANDIRNPKSRLDKIGAKTGQRAALVAVSDEELPDELARAGVEIVAGAAKTLDLVFVEANTPAALARVPKAAARIAPTGAVWVITPRGVEGVKDVDVMKVARAAGLVDVKVVRFSGTHTALKFMVPKSKR